MMNDIKSRLRVLFLENMGLDIDNMNPDENLAERGIGSIIFIKLIVLIEVEFEIEFEDDKLNISDFCNVNELIKYIESKVAEKSIGV